MFYKILTAGLLLAVTSTAFAQKIDLNVGPIIDKKQVRKEMALPTFKMALPFKPIRYSTDIFFNTKTKKTYNGIGFEGKSFSFGVLDDYVKYSGARKLASENFSEKVAIQAFISMEGRMFIFYTVPNEKTDDFTLYVNELSADMVMMGSPIVIHKYTGLKDYGRSIDVFTSKDKKKIAFTRLYIGKGKDIQKASCKVIDSSLSEVWYKEFEYEGTDKELAVRSFAIDNAGNFYSLVKYDNKKDGQSFLYTYFHKEKSWKSHAVGLADGKNFGTNLEVLNGEKCYVVGLNNTDKKISYFINSINPKTMQIEKLGSNPMPEDFYKASSFRSFSTDDWQVSNLISLANNNIVASIEAMLVETRNGVPVAWYTYNTYVVSFKDNGQANWTHTVYKKQAVLQQAAGHVLVPAGDDVLIIYNDDIDNLAKKPDDKKVEVCQRPTQTMAVVQQLDAAGKPSKYLFSKNKELTNYMVDLSNTQIIEGKLWYAPMMLFKSVFNIEMRSVTFNVL
jgi:hypothetical protein